jgi:hypothetical protein
LRTGKWLIVTSMRLSVTCPEDCSNFLGRSKPPRVPIPAVLLFASPSRRSYYGGPIHKGE